MPETFTERAMKWIKPFKRFFQGEGKMMGTFEDIRAAYYATDATRLNEIMKDLKEDRPYFWSPHYQKTKELVALCQMLLATNPKAQSDARWRLGVILDTNHELGRRILEFIGEIAPQLADVPEHIV